MSWGANDIPWIVVLTGCFGTLLLWESIRIFTSKKDDTPATKGDIEGLKNQWAQMTTMEEAFEKMNPEPFGSDGIRTATAPTGTVFVKSRASHSW